MYAELWSTYHSVHAANVNPPNRFLEDHILTPKGCCALKFLHMLENDSGLLVHTPQKMAAFPTIFYTKRGSQLTLNVAYEPLELWR